MSKKNFLKGTLILTCAGLLTRFMGFFYRIFLSQAIGAQGLGIYQLVMPLQAIVMAISVSGIQTAISRICASKAALGEEQSAGDTFVLGTVLSVSLSGFLSLLLWKNASFFALEILKEPRTCPLIKLISLSFPLSAVHTCVSSYYFSRKQTGLPSGVQLLEQIIRVGSCYVLYQIFLSEGRAVTPVIAVGGSLAGEVASCLVCLLAVSGRFQKMKYRISNISAPRSTLKGIGAMALPLSLNRLLLNLLSSMEVVLIPQMLRAHGLSSEEALGIYGVFTGMALPLILFPSAFTNSASVMLMPSVAEMQALGYQKRISYVIRKATVYCMGMGGFCALGFLLLGEFLGVFLFQSPTAGIYIRSLAFMCPFLYLNGTLSGILNGLGKAGLCLIHNLAGVCLRIGFVILAIPHMGIRGYFYGLLLSQLLMTALQLLSLHVIQKRGGCNLPIDN